MSEVLAEYEAAKNAAIDARLRLETRLEEIETERTQIRTLLGRTRAKKTAKTTITKQRKAKPAITDGASS